VTVLQWSKCKARRGQRAWGEGDDEGREMMRAGRSAGARFDKVCRL
jgi:hypothetical protein